MRKWYVSLTMLGLGGLGMLFVTERGKRAVKTLLEHLEEPEGAADFHAGVDRELAQIESELDEIAAELAR